VVDMTKMDGYTATVDCDVIQADGGTRTASITGSAVALYIALEKYVRKGKFTENPMQELIAALSVGLYENEIVVDLDYELDSNAQVDMNIVMTESHRFVEIQGTGEKCSFTKDQLQGMLHLAEHDISTILETQREVLRNYVYE